MWRTAFGVVLVVYGLLTTVIWAPGPNAEAPMDTSRSWLLGETRSVSVALAVWTLLQPLVAAGDRPELRAGRLRIP